MRFSPPLLLLSISAAQGCTCAGPCSQAQLPQAQGASSLSQRSAVGNSPSAAEPTPESARPLSVCHFDKPVAAEAPGADDLVRVLPSDPRLTYLGRVDCSHADAIGFAHPGAVVRFRLKGTAFDFLYRDHGNGSPTGTNFFSVLIDQRAPLVIAVNPKQEVYPIIRNLPPGEHTVEIFKRTESGQLGQAGVGQGEFLGLRVPRTAQLLPAYPKAHRVEFIGDSITCGYGTELTTTEPDKAHYSSRNSSAYASWATVTARNLDADLMLVCYSGRGVYRNYASGTGEAIPQLYHRIYPDNSKSPTWDFRAFTPEVVVVNLGTNDFSPGGVNRKSFREAYAAFLKTLRAHYPEATLVVAVGPMMSDNWPPNENAWTSIQADVNALIAQRRAGGDNNVHVLILPTQQGPFGEDWHPTVMEQYAMATKATDLIRALRSW